MKCKICGTKYSWGENLRRSVLRTCCWCDEIKTQIKKCDIEKAIESARYRAKDQKNKISKRLSRDEKEMLIKSCVKNVHVDKAVRSAQLKNRDLSDQELNFLLKGSIMKGDLKGANKIANLLNRRMTIEEIDNLTRSAIKIMDLDNIFSIARLGASLDVLDLVVKAAISEGTIYKVKTALQIRGSSLSKAEACSLIQVHTDKGNVKETFEAVELRGVPLSTNERNDLAQSFKREKWHYCGNKSLEIENSKIALRHANFGYINDALSAARVASKDTIHKVIDALAE